MANTTQISFRIPNDLLSRLRIVAQHQDRTVSNLLSRIARHYLTTCYEPQRPDGQPPSREGWEQYEGEDE